MEKTRPIALFDPFPRSEEIMFLPKTFKSLTKLVELKPGPDDVNYQAPAPAQIDSILQEATYVIGQTDLPRARLEAAPNLKAIFNVEGNFLPNIDYDYCFTHNIKVLNVSPVFASAVAELGLGMALSLARRIPQAHFDFLTGSEKYGLEDNSDAILLSEVPIGIVGFGDLGRALLRILRPFGRTIKVFDPWLPERSIIEAGAKPTSLQEVLTN
jgi:phosphoglycerate dehydrogenase-like enzyme